ncbi:hypothetical protein CMUS01_16720 [Colletotrichum musicola]|uniref:Uncharacterized protein n=1 Tax=Colletotrichum musicola TaxID=2175873 RepID=A0A8H6IKU4_9PEZI|nr:hypothetical protein CMUS01_16720 [Colletotrichum musicola]
MYGNEDKGRLGFLLHLAHVNVGDIVLPTAEKPSQRITAEQALSQSTSQAAAVSATATAAATPLPGRSITLGVVLGAIPLLLLLLLYHAAAAAASKCSDAEHAILVHARPLVQMLRPVRHDTLEQPRLGSRRLT